MQRKLGREEAAQNLGAQMLCVSKRVRVVFAYDLIVNAKVPAFDA